MYKYVISSMTIVFENRFLMDIQRDELTDISNHIVAALLKSVFVKLYLTFVSSKTLHQKKRLFYYLHSLNTIWNTFFKELLLKFAPSQHIIWLSPCFASQAERKDRKYLSKTG